MSGNVVPFTGQRVQAAPLPLATVQSGATRISHGGLNDTYHGEILLTSGEVRLAYIKDLDARELANELIVACLAKWQGWRVPDTYLALADAAALPLAKAPPGPGGKRLVLASSDAQSPSLRQFYDTSNFVAATILARKLAQSTAVSQLYAIDTWCANTDRNLGNVLVGANDVWFIDHGRCFVTPHIAPTALEASTGYRNLLLHWLTPEIPTAQRAGIANEAATEALIADSLLDQLDTLSHANAIVPRDDTKALISFLKDRRSHVRELTAQALALLVA